LPTAKNPEPSPEFRRRTFEKRLEVKSLHLPSLGVEDYPGRLHHKTPEWVRDGALFHLRIRVAPAQTTALIGPALGPQLLAAARRYHELGQWWCDLFMLMPDHAHAIVAFPHEAAMSETLRNWKRGTARFQRVAWQEGYFDHRLRNDREAGETRHYIRHNPVVKNLCAAADDWPWWWSASDAGERPTPGKTEDGDSSGGRALEGGAT